MKVPAAAQLLPRYARASIGYRVLTTGRATFSDYTRSGVVEERPAFYVVRGGADVPDGGGFIAWGTGVGNTIAEESVAPAAPDHTEPIRADIAERFDHLGEMFAAQLREMHSSVVTETEKALEAIIELGKMRNELNQAKSELNEALRASVSEISEKLSPQNANMQYIAELITRLEESQGGELDLDNRLSGILKSIGNVRMALGETDNRIASIGHQMARLEESGKSDIDQRQADTLRILNEATRLLS